MLFTTITNLLAGESGLFSLAAKDLRSGRQYVYRSQPIRAASMIKIFMMVEAYQQAKQGLLDFQETVTITAACKTPGAGHLHLVPEGTRKTLYELTELMITESDNTATNIMMDKLGLAAINGRIAALNCPDTILQRKMMDWESAKAGKENFTSVLDINNVLEKIHLRRCLDTASDESMLGILFKQADKVKIPRLLPATVAIAHKTGELTGAEHDGGIVYANNPYILSIMTDHLTDAEKGKDLVAALAKAVYDFFNP